MIKRIAALAFALLLCFGVLTCHAEGAPDSPRRTLIQAHRGASSIAPENTMAAFHMAKAIGADGIEMDIRMTKDHQLVLRHEDEIGFTSDSHGLISEMTLDELKAVDFGQWYGPEYAGETILTLEETLRVAKELDFQTLNLEMKPIGVNKKEFVHAIADVIEQSGLTERVMVSSFDSGLLKEMKRYAPNISVALLTIPNLSALSLIHLSDYLPGDKPLAELTAEDVTDMPGMVPMLLSGFGARGNSPEEILIDVIKGIAAIAPEGSSWNDVEALIFEQMNLILYVDALDFRIDYLNCHYSTLTEELMTAMHERGIGVNVWTPDTKSTLENALALNVDGIITNKPEMALALRDQATAESTIEPSSAEN